MFVTFQIWQKVKAANQNSSVCEIGATIGRMWREMNEIDKQHYNDDFVHDKVPIVCLIDFSLLESMCIQSSTNQRTSSYFV